MTVAETVSQLRRYYLLKAALAFGIAMTLWTLLRHVWHPALPEFLYSHGGEIVALLCAVGLAQGQFKVLTTFRALEKEPAQEVRHQLYAQGMKTALNANLTVLLLALVSGWLIGWGESNVFMLGISVLLLAGRIPSVSHASRMGLRD